MSSDETPNVPSPRHSREAVREKAQKVHAKQSRARVMRRTIIALVAVVVVGAAGVGVAWAVGSAVGKPELTPSNMKDDGVVVHDLAATTQNTATDATPTPTPVEQSPTGGATPTPTGTPRPVDIHVYVDYLSPNAGDFERTNARQLASWIDQGAATVAYHPIALLTANSNGTKYSLRAAAAAACVANYASDKFYAYNHELLTDQPSLDSDGKSDTQLADLAQAVGVSDVKGVRSCIEKKDYAGWAKDATTRAVEGPLPGSKDLTLNAAPTVVVNGQAYIGALDDPAEFSQFVLSVASDAYYGTPSPSPSSTPTHSPTPTATPAP
ncbi:protein-disulfide isomerase [Microbacterium resistens]|uniref:Protein-disulfide isomerase n=1 Tax=Microbacterium resistens TaxID=156977 RepID=A0ABU1SDA5_9MICO|nr:thioredoxin domain-containing protein [Microbacterium resistens]MDR6867559.1 protein-disulfide isomerase [Microbacterium resistens]